MARVSIIIPVYNEVERIAEAIAGVHAALGPLGDYEIVVVDDGSHDGTIAILETISNIQFVRHERNAGKGAAIRTGVRAAIGEHIVIHDADLEYDPADIPALLAPLVTGQSRVVLGNRMHAGNSIGYRRYYVGNQLISWFARLIHGRHVADVETGAKAFHRDVLHELAVTANDFGFEAEVVSKLLATGEPIVEVPVRYTPRSFAQGKKIGWRDGIKALWLIAKHRRRSTAPMVQPEPISRREWRWLAWLTLGLIIITTAPIMYGWLITPAGFVFTGVHFSSLNDWFVYYSYFAQVNQGHWLFADLFAPVAHIRTLHPVWLGIGLLGRAFQLGPVATFQLARILLIPAYAVAAYIFIAQIIDDRRWRQIGMYLLTFGGGLGVVLLNRFILFPGNFEHGAFQWPMDLWVPEAFSFLTLYYTPHFIAALVLIILMMLGTLRRITGGFRWTLLAGVSAGVLFSFHPFEVISMLSVIGAVCVAVALCDRRLAWRMIGHVAMVGACALPAVAYYSWLLRIDWLMQIKTLQNLTFTTPVWITLWSYGGLLLLALVGLPTLLRRPLQLRYAVVVVWFVVHALAIYTPVPYQRRMTAGLQVPLAIAATFGVIAITSWVRQRRTRLQQVAWSQRFLLGVGGTLLLTSSAIFALAADVTMYRMHAPYAYVATEDVAAAQWLRQTPETSIVFATAKSIISIIPAYSGRTVYVGHGVETPWFRLKQTEVDWFFSKNRDATLEQNFLHQRRVTHVWYGPDEQAAGSYDPSVKPYLRLVYENARIRIYEVL